MQPIVGVLALQGGYASHVAVLSSLGAIAREIRVAEDLADCDALVLPGGESTVLTKLLMKPGTGPETGTAWEPNALRDAIGEFIGRKPAMGTCAGLIMLAKPCDDPRVVSFGALSVEVERNAYGRQTESFIEGIDVRLEGETIRYPATFIRAPRIVSVGPGVTVLATEGRGGSPVMVRQGNVLGLTFHPELTPSRTEIHRFFLGFR
jgi:pyridoxal 5'-phosphate synthase pdxT subunit